ncbi:hypothetical protein [Paenibacillus sp. Marseille-Q4541]|uniref:hypothetical protein n=1 Tax=Paenibacillus sp. Marseille-Q4541 TaxID=2831522 RepID=UPI001BA71D04|nr:hypothetical protein [Paenibacillus sp. Marseille-Q4541]
MEDQMMEQTGVEEVPVAEVQDTVVNEQVEDTGVESSEVAAQNDGGGFAKALKAREEQIRAKLEQEYSSKAQQAQQMLERTAELYGFSDLESYQAALDQAEQDRRIQEEAQKLGVDEDVIRNHMSPLNDRLSKAEQELQQYREAESIRAVEAQIASLNSKYPDFGQHQESIIKMSIEKGYDLEDAYILTTYQERVNNAVTEAKRETLKNIQQNADSSTGYLGADAPDQASGYSAMSAAERKSFRDRVKSGQI